MKKISNPFRNSEQPVVSSQIDPIVDDPSLVLELLAKCPAAQETPLAELPGIAADLGIGRLLIKDERGRMGLGSFKALGATFAIAKAAHQKIGDQIANPQLAKSALAGQTYVAATAGNHGISVAAGARVFGARAVIYIAETVPESFAARLRGQGAEVHRGGADYAASLTAAKRAADENGWQLLSDTSWPEYQDMPRDVMEGYLAMAAEIVAQAAKLNARPSHIFLQAGVGGLAAAVAVHLRKMWGQSPLIFVVEPGAAPALQASILAGAPVIAPGPVSNMGRLDCKEPSHLALQALARAADGFLTVSDDEAVALIADLAACGMATSPSGGAGYAALKLACDDDEFGLGPDSSALLILSEGPADD